MPDQRDTGASRVRTAVAWGLMAVLMLGCASIAESKKFEQLEQRQKLYAKAIRWSAYDTAAALIRTRDSEDKVTDLSRYEAYRVTGYEELGSTLSADQNESVNVVLFRFYHAETGSVHKLRQTQLWWYDEESRSWYLDGTLPDFESAMAH